MIARGSLRGYVDSLVHAGGHPALVYLAHGEEAHAEPAYQLTLAGVNVTRPYVRAEARVELWREAFDAGQLGRAVAEERREWHPVNVTRGTGLGRVHVCVCVEPDEADRLAALTEERGHARDRADGDRVVAA